MKGSQFFVRYRGFDGSYASSQPIGVIQSVDKRAVVSTVASRLDNHVTTQPKMISQPPEHLLRTVTWRVFTLGSVGKALTGTKDVTVRIDRTCRENKRGFSGIGVINTPSEIHFKITHCLFTPRLERSIQPGINTTSVAFKNG